MRLFTTVFGIDLAEPDIVKVAVEAVRQGYAVVPVRPGTKRPDVCTLTAAAIKKVGKAHRCGVHHAITDDKVARTVFARLSKEFAPHRLNLGIVAYPSRLIVVDCDTAAAVDAFRHDWAAATGDPGYLTASPTVRTPGMIADGGEWIHKDGGHFIFEAGVELEIGPGALKRNGYDVRWGWSMSVVPPSVRSEGQYVPSGNVIEAPEWLLTAISGRLEAYAERVALHGAVFGNDAVAQWSQRASWADLLVPDGWEDTGKLDGCGCPVFTRPGEPSTYRSATGHEAWCDRWENNEDHGPLHFWTDNPPEPLASWMGDHGRTVTKLTYVALTHHAGDVGAAKVALGIDPDPAWLGDLGDGTRGRDSTPSTPVPGPQSPRGRDGGRESTGVPSPSRPKITGDGEFFRADEPEEVRSAILREASRLVIRDRAEQYVIYRTAGERSEPLPFDKLEIEPIAPGVAFTVPDEAGMCIPLLYPGKVSTIWGPSESGKSWFGLACAIDVVQRGGKAMIVDLEDSPAGWRSRIEALDTPIDLSRLLYIQPTALDEVERAMIRKEAEDCDLVVVDSFDELLALMRLDSSNNATAVRTTGALLRSWARIGGAAVLVVDHSTDKAVEGPSTTAMGSSAKKQQIDGAMLRADRLTEWGPKLDCRTMIMLGKDRHGGLKPHTERNPDSRDPRAFARLALLRLTESIEGGFLRILAPPSYADQGETSSESLFDIQGLMLEYLRHEARGEWRSQSQVFSKGGDKNGRKGQPAALKGLVDMDLVEEDVQEAKAGARLVTKRYRYRNDDDRPPSQNPGGRDGDGPDEDTESDT